MASDGITRMAALTWAAVFAFSAAAAQPEATVFDAPGMPGVRMMAPIPDKAAAKAPAKPAVKSLARAAPKSSPAPVARSQVPPPPAPREKPARVAEDFAVAQAPASAPVASLTAPGPATPSLAVKISPAKRANMKQAFTFASRGDWMRARNFALLTGDPVFGTLIQWRYLLEAGPAAPFEETDSFLNAHANWPRREGLLAAAERSMPEYLGSAGVISWYGARTPITPQGKIALGEALIATGDTQRGEALIRKAWIEGNFSPAGETELLDRHGGTLTPADHRAKLRHLLERDDGAAVKRQQARTDPGAQRIANARLRIKASPALAATVMAGLPDSLKSDPDLRFDFAKSLRGRKQDREAWDVLAAVAPDPSTPVLADLRWQERHIMTRDALKAGEPAVAYRLASQHGMDQGANFADAEFLSGWIALRFLNMPETALSHFRRLAGAVSLPISKARAHYWQGRALEELGQMAEAASAYRNAAASRETFYGQLALARIEEAPQVPFAGDVSPPSGRERDAFEGDERVAAIRILADLGERDRARLFAIKIANDTPNAPHLDMLAQLMTSIGDPAMGVRVAKIASYAGIVLPQRLAPVVPLPKFPGAGPAPDPALVLGLARQESEFDPRVVSSAGARGLMQLMPATARKAAMDHGLVYRAGDLTERPQYNLQLGMAVISDYMEPWSGSFILGIASYNAGVGNVRRWVETNGDPRDPTVDPIDWIERIPFGETRNYVQRVLENVQVYRSRLTGNGKLNILADLYRPRMPEAAILAYAPPQAAAPLPQAPDNPAAAVP